MKTTVHVTEASIFATGSALAPRRPLAAGSAVSSTHCAIHSTAYLRYCTLRIIFIVWRCFTRNATRRIKPGSTSTALNVTHHCGAFRTSPNFSAGFLSALHLSHPHLPPPHRLLTSPRRTSDHRSGCHFRHSPELFKQKEKKLR